MSLGRIYQIRWFCRAAENAILYSREKEEYFSKYISSVFLCFGVKLIRFLISVRRNNS